MLTLLTICGLFCGVEGIEDNKIYFGIYTPQTEYGFVLKDFSEIYLDTVLVKRYNDGNH